MTGRFQQALGTTTSLLLVAVFFLVSTLLFAPQQVVTGRKGFSVPAEFGDNISAFLDLYYRGELVDPDTGQPMPYDPSNPPEVELMLYDEDPYFDNVTFPQPVNIVIRRREDVPQIVIRPQTAGRIMTIDGSKLNSKSYVEIRGLTFEGGSANDDVTVPGLEGCGGAILVAGATSPVVLAENQIRNNVAATSRTGRGGGVCLMNTSATLERNVISANVASRDAQGQGGGVYVRGGQPQLRYNQVDGNTTGTTSGGGGGIFLKDSAAQLTGNTIFDNADTAPDDFRSNGVRIEGGDGWLLTSNIVVRNRFLGSPGRSGAGIVVENGKGTLLHTTVADNDGISGSANVQAGIELEGTATVVAVNTIIAGHDVGVWSRASTARASVTSTLFFANGRNLRADAGTPISNLGEVASGDPGFATTGATPPDYHIRGDSAARDKGASTSAPADIDAGPRAVGPPDIGADEFPYTFTLRGTATPTLVPPGGPIEYTFTYGMLGNGGVSGATVRATLPNGVTDVVPDANGTVSGNVVTWNVGPLTPGEEASLTIAANLPNAPDTPLTATARITGGDNVSAETSVVVRTLPTGQQALVPLPLIGR